MKYKWLAEAGIAGCLPGFTSICDTKADAIQTVTDLFDLSRYGRVAKDLSQAGDTVSDRDESEHDLMRFQVYKVVPADLNVESWDELEFNDDL